MLSPTIQPHPLTWGPIPDLFIDPAEDDRRTIVAGAETTIEELGNKTLGFANLEQPLIDDQPRYQPNGINSRGCIESVDSPSDERLYSINDVSVAPTNFFLQLVWRYTADPGHYIINCAFNDSNSIQYLLSMGGDGILLSRPYYQYGGGSVGIIYSSLNLTQNQAYIIEVSYDQANSLHSLTINGLFQGSSSDMITLSVNRFKIWTVHAAIPTPPMQCGIILIQREIPSALSIEKRRRYLANYYNISI